jgi:hypothetical protein
MQGNNYAVRRASRDLRVIYTDSYDNLHTVNDNCLMVAGSLWCFFEVHQQQSGAAGVSLAISRGISSTQPTCSAIPGATNVPFAQRGCTLRQPQMMMQ